MRNLKSFFISPYILALAPFLIIAILTWRDFNRYLLETDSSAKLPENQYIRYDDLDGDGSSEKLAAFDQLNSTGLAISAENGIIEQWNFKGNFNFNSKECLFITGDKDSNGTKEIYVFTLLSDSILLHCISDLHDPVPSVSNRLIAVAGEGIKSPDPFIIPAEMEDLDGDGTKELIFGIGSGFSGYPRNVFAYYISKDSLIVSPESSYFIWRILQADITGNGKKEIIPYGYATGNIGPDKAKYHDYSSFLMVLDQSLNFLFEPVEFKGKYSKITPFIKKTERGNTLGLLHNNASGETNAVIYSADNKGTITDSVRLPYYAIDIMNTSWGENKDLLLVNIPSKGLSILNDRLGLIKTVPVEKSSRVCQADLDNDGRKEILLTDRETGKIIIYREGLRNPVAASLSFENSSLNLISVKLIKSSDPAISIQSGKNLYMLKYRKNPAYPFYYLLYPLVYLGILAFTFTVKNIQRNQLKKKYDNEKKISELQLALIRNQLDPHFTLNVINSIIYSVEYSDRDLAGEQLRQFANLYRNLLLSASVIRRSIEEELDFCRDYLLLEKMRFKEKFNFRIVVPDDVNKNTLIPKMLIQLHVENAVKHGLMPREEGGHLNIGLKNLINGVSVEITDNGIGRALAEVQKKTGTGKGLEIMNELFKIYNKYYNEKVSSEIIDMYDDNGQSSGTKVVIRIVSHDDKG